MYTILYAEDEPILRRDVTEVLDDAGYRVVATDNGAKALALIHETHPDLILCDIAMPGMSGHELLRAIRSDSTHMQTPFVFLTAFSDGSNLFEGKREEADDYLTKPVDFDLLLATVEGRLNHAKRMELTHIQDLICRLSRVSEYRDPETGNHIQRMAHYSAILARSLGLEEEDRNLILITAPMHDVGKVGIPDHILLKAGKLTETEWGVMKEHTTIGHEILNGSPSPVLRAASEIALSHHERFDGTGYPQERGRKDIPMFARIAAVADVFDALTSKRPYKDAWSADAALNYIRSESGHQFDPICVEALLREEGSVRQVMKTHPD